MMTMLNTSISIQQPYKLMQFKLATFALPSWQKNLRLYLARSHGSPLSFRFPTCDAGISCWIKALATTDIHEMKHGLVSIQTLTVRRFSMDYIANDSLISALHCYRTSSWMILITSLEVLKIDSYTPSRYSDWSLYDRAILPNLRRNAGMVALLYIIQAPNLLELSIRRSEGNKFRKPLNPKYLGYFYSSAFIQSTGSIKMFLGGLQRKISLELYDIQHLIYNDHDHICLAPSLRILRYIYQGNRRANTRYYYSPQ
ncbi:hypothetical protein BDQ17DRAFT_1354933 [Cyathus striatus]|nr:hypothetical protein BDQ17DRAFT_1354933 [Cyathus striatus]